MKARPSFARGLHGSSPRRASSPVVAVDAREPAGEIGERSEIRLAERADRAHARREARIQRGDEVLGEADPHARPAVCEAGELRHHGRTDGGLRRVRTGACPVRAEHQAVEAELLVRPHAHALERADARRQPVHALVAGKHVLGQTPRRRDAVSGAVRQLDPTTAQRNVRELVDRERVVEHQRIRQGALLDHASAINAGLRRSTYSQSSSRIASSSGGGS